MSETKIKDRPRQKHPHRKNGNGSHPVHPVVKLQYQERVVWSAHRLTSDDDPKYLAYVSSVCTPCNMRCSDPFGDIIPAGGSIAYLHCLSTQEVSLMGFLTTNLGALNPKKYALMSPILDPGVANPLCIEIEDAGTIRIHNTGGTDVRVDVRAYAM